jgi:large subunit ribosomal protein L15
VRSGDLTKVGGNAIDLEGLKKAGLVPAGSKRAKIILAGEVSGKFSVSGVAASKGAREAIQKAGGSVAEIAAVERPKKLPKKNAAAQATK